MALALIPHTVECLVTTSGPPLPRIFEQSQGFFMYLDSTCSKFLPSVNAIMFLPKVVVLSPHSFVRGMISACPISYHKTLQHRLLLEIGLASVRYNGGERTTES